MIQNNNIKHPNDGDPHLDYNQAKTLVQIIAASFKIYKLGFINIISTSAILSIPILLITHLILLLLNESIPSNSLYQFFTKFVEDFGKIIIASALIHCVCQHYLSSKISVSKAYTAVIQRFLSLLQIAVFTSLALVLLNIIKVRFLEGVEKAVILGQSLKESGGDAIAVDAVIQSNLPVQDAVILLVGWILFLILSVYLFNLINSIIVDGLHLNHAISQTINILQQNWWRVCGIFIGIFCLGYIAKVVSHGAIFIVVSQNTTSSQILRMLLTEITFCLLILPLMVIIITNLFFDLKARKQFSVY